MTPRASSSPTPTTASETAITVGPGVVMWTRRTTRDVTTLVTDQTSNGRVAWPRVAPSPCWTSPAAFEAIAMMPSPTTAEPMVATRKAGDLISAGSTRGSATRRWTTANPVPRATAATLRPSISGVSPVRASVTAATSAARPSESRTTPVTSTRRGVTADDSRRP